MSPHHASGHRRHLALRTPPSRHATVRFARLRSQPALVALIGMLAAISAVPGGLLLHQTNEHDSTPADARPLPAISIPAPRIAAVFPGPAWSPKRAERRQATVRPVLLGPKNLSGSLTAYCKDTVSAATRARVTPDGWQCGRLVASRSIGMNAACRWLYHADAWAGMLDDDDQQSWRCYRDPS